MSNIKISCVGCNQPMDLISEGNLNKKPSREIWCCDNCKTEVLVVHSD